MSDIQEVPGGIEVGSLFFEIDFDELDAKSEADIAAGRVWSHEDVMREAERHANELMKHRKRLYG